MNRIYHPFTLWEDHKHGFYGGLEYDNKNALKLCAALLKDPNMFEHALARIIIEWPYSLEHNLTNDSLNKIAYLGQAACSLLHNIPNSVSMGAWSMLSEDEQKQADAIAQKYLDLWREKHESIKKVSG